VSLQVLAFNALWHMQGQNFQTHNCHCSVEDTYSKLYSLHCLLYGYVVSLYLWTCMLPPVYSSTAATVDAVL
jgi:hypothetical protein